MCNFFISGKIRSVAPVFLIIFFTRFIFLELSKGQDFTLNQILSVPYSYYLVSDPHEDRIAWVENRKGIRNIRIASTPDFKPVQTTDLAQRLRKRGVHTEVLIFPDKVHSFLRYESWLRAFHATADFFNRFLK